MSTPAAWSIHDVACKSVCLLCWQLLAVVLIRAVQLEATGRCLPPRGHQAAAGASPSARHSRAHSHPRRNRAGLRPAGSGSCGPLSLVAGVARRALAAADGPARLSPAERKVAARLAAEQAAICRERIELRRRAAQLCGVSAEQWMRPGRPRPGPCGRDRCRCEPPPRVEGCDKTAATIISRPRQPKALGGVARFIRGRAHASRPGGRGTPVSRHGRRRAAGRGCGNRGQSRTLAGRKNPPANPPHYPAGTLAAHVLGYLGPADPPPQGESRPETEGNDAQELTGRAGLERQYQVLLRGRRGTAVELTDHSGRLSRSLSSTRARRRPRPGADAGCQIATNGRGIARRRLGAPGDPQRRRGAGRRGHRRDGPARAAPCWRPPPHRDSTPTCSSAPTRPDARPC